MKIAFSLKEGILEYTAKVLVESAIFKLKYSSLEEADFIFVFNRSLGTDCNKEIQIFKEDNDKDFLIRVLREVKKRFKNKLIQMGFNNLEWFAKSFSKIESSDLISDVILSYREHDIDVSSMSKEDLVELLKHNVKFTSRVDEMLGVKLHLYANHSKLTSYYKWLRYKFKNLYMYNKPRCGNRFFTDSEINSFYRSLASKISYISEILDDSVVELIERTNELINGTEHIYIITVSSISRALNEVLLKSDDYEHLIVCCKSDNVALYSYWEGNEAVHRVISNKNKVERIVEYIEPLSN